MKLSSNCRLLEARIPFVFFFYFLFSKTSTWSTTASLMKLLSAARDDVAELIRGSRSGPFKFTTVGLR